MIGETKYPDLMLDIETLSNTPNSVILSIAAVPFNGDTFEVAPREECFHEFFLAQSDLHEGADINIDTVMWWMRQSDEARDKLRIGQRRASHPYNVLNNLKNFVWSISPEAADSYGTTPVRVWGNGASFDLPILENAFRRHQEQIPWRYSGHRCFRTLKTLLPQSRMPALMEPVIAHDALEDAYAQAQNATAILKVLHTRTE